MPGKPRTHRRPSSDTSSVRNGAPRILKDVRRPKHLRAVISIGTNSTRCLVADFGPPLPRIVAEHSIGTRIGEGLRASGQLGLAPMQRTLAAISEHFRITKRYTMDLAIIATSALRRAENAASFQSAIHEITRTDVHILSGDEEARCSYRGAVATYAAGQNRRFGVLDVGGGSTEYALGRDGDVQRTVSCEIGAVRLGEAFPALLTASNSADAEALVAHARAVAAKILEPLRLFTHADTVIVVGGTATTTAAILSRPFQRQRTVLTRDELYALTLRLVQLGLPDRRRVRGMRPQRADILPAGLIVIDVALESVRHAFCHVGRTDLLLGYLVEAMARSQRRP